MPEPTKVWVSSVYGHNTRKPLVKIEAETLDQPLQISPNEARDLALNLLEAAEAADQDAFMFEFVTQVIGQTEQVAASILIDFRDWRKKQRDQ